MAVKQQPLQRNQLVAGVEERLTRFLYLDGEKVAYVIIFVLAILTRFWDLGTRVMSHDESLHVRFSWLLYQGEGFQHTPLMHGPLLFHMTALSYWLFGANDFTGRVYTALLGVAIVMMPVFMRKWLGKTGAIVASVLFLISPFMLYYSRYIRHDIPSIIAALVMAVAIWRYIETRKFGNLVWLGVAQSVLFASKEVSFIYVAIFGSFLTLFLILRLFDVEWNKPGPWRGMFVGGLIATLILLVGLVVLLEVRSSEPTATGEPTVVNPEEANLETQGGQPFNPDDPLDIPFYAEIGLLAVSITVMTAGVVIGQWENLRRFPELDAAIVMGTLVLPWLTPFAIDFFGFDPMAQDQRGIAISAAFTIPVALVSVAIGVVWFLKPPHGGRTNTLSHYFGGGDTLGASDDPEDEFLVGVPSQVAGRIEPEEEEDEDAPLTWGEAILRSRWWAIGGAFWAIYFFFFTTMFTNGAGIGTGVVGSLGYWLDQHAVQRGGQPWYYYLMIQIPMYEFLPAILSIAAGGVGLVALSRRLFTPSRDDDEPVSRPPRVDLNAPVSFPVLLFIGWWAVLNLIAYSWAGEKMPWLTTHLTTPMILLGGWMVGRTIDRVEWGRVWQTYNWVLVLLIPMLAVTLLRVSAPACLLWEANPLCNTVISESVQVSVIGDYSTDGLAATGGWAAALLVFLGALYAALLIVPRVGWQNAARMVGLWGVLWLGFLTARQAWTANYINYDEATEYLVYAHSAGSVKDVLERIEEISLQTTDGLGLRVAYDNKALWPMTWYFRDYENAVYFADQPSRGLIGDAPVIIAGPPNWADVEQIIGERYYEFEYIRMWWPIEHYKVYQDKPLAEGVREFAKIFGDPDLQRGLWDIFYYRDYDAYSEAVVDYRPNFQPVTLSEWPVPDRMRVYIRKDVFAQVWDYGVAASEIAEAIDPYSQTVLNIQPEFVFGGGDLSAPHGIAQDAEGRIYIADTENHRIAVYDQTGRLVNSIGRQGFAPAEGVLNEPWDVAVASDGSVLVADTWNFRVVRFSADGEFLDQWGTEGPGQTDDPFALWGPRGIAVDSEDRVYVSDTGNKRILVYTLEGEYRRQIGTGGALEGQLDEPAGVAVGPDGEIYVADTWNQRIQVFSPEGVFQRQWYIEAWFAQTNERPYLDVSADGLVYVADPEGFRVIVFDSAGEFVYSFGDFDQLNLAGPLLVTDQGELYVVDTAAGQVKRFLATGEIPEGEGPQ